MNITPNKIPKLIRNKHKKQSAKRLRYKKRTGKRNNGVSRRNNRPVNLANSTLKSYKTWFGGATSSVPIIVPTTIDNRTDTSTDVSTVTESLQIGGKKTRRKQRGGREHPPSSRERFNASANESRNKMYSAASSVHKSVSDATHYGLNKARVATGRPLKDEPGAPEEHKEGGEVSPTHVTKEHKEGDEVSPTHVTEEHKEGADE